MNFKTLIVSGIFILSGCASSRPNPALESRAAREEAIKSEAVQKFDAQIQTVDEKMAELREKISGAEGPANELPASEKARGELTSLRRELSTLQTERAYLQSKRNHALLNAGTTRP